MRSLAAALPIDERTAAAYAQLAAGVLSGGHRPRVHDTWIAATALVNDAEVWMQDTEFSGFVAAVAIVQV